MTRSKSKKKTEYNFFCNNFQPFQCQPHKMVKHTQTTCRQQPTNCFNVFEHSVGLALKGLISRAINPFHPTGLYLYLPGFYNLYFSGIQKVTSGRNNFKRDRTTIFKALQSCVVKRSSHQVLLLISIKFKRINQL